MHSYTHWLAPTRTGTTASVERPMAGSQAVWVWVWRFGYCVWARAGDVNFVSAAGGAVLSSEEWE